MAQNLKLIFWHGTNYNALIVKVAIDSARGEEYFALEPNSVRG